jgi:hypothetical protein
VNDNFLFFATESEYVWLISIGYRIPWDAHILAISKSMPEDFPNPLFKAFSSKA